MDTYIGIVCSNNALWDLGFLGMHVCAYWADRFAGCIEIEFISSGADPSVGVDHRRSLGGHLFI